MMFSIFSHPVPCLKFLLPTEEYQGLSPLGKKRIEGKGNTHTERNNHRKYVNYMEGMNNNNND